MCGRGARVAGTDEDVPGSLTKSEIKGFLEGPFLYLSSRKRNKPGAPRQAEPAPAQDSVTAPSSAEEAQASSPHDAEMPDQNPEGQQ